MTVVMPTEPVERVDYNDDGTLDDVAITTEAGGMFRLEQMSKHSWWLALYMADGSRHVFRLSSKGRVHALYEREAP